MGIKNKSEYYKAVKYVKSRVNKWPSAYASGMVVKRYKNMMAKKGKQAYSDDTHNKKLLARWFKEKWIDIVTGKPCGSVNYPICRPSKRITKNTPITVKEMKGVSLGSNRFKFY